MIYVDMDGVLVNSNTQFKKFFKEGTWIEVQRKKGYEYGVNLVKSAGLDFWTTAPWTPDGKQLWFELLNYEPNLFILSSPKDFEYAIEGKKIWIKNNIGSYFKNYILSNEKEKYAKLGDILIDDYKKNIKKWENSGGIGIVHKSTKETLQQIYKYI